MRAREMMMGKSLKKLSVVCAGVATLISMAFLVGRARAAGVPATDALTYSGTLEDETGKALGAGHNVEIRFWGSASGGSNTLCTSSGVSAEAGSFSIVLSAACSDAVKANPNIWVEILADGASLGRTKLGAVPFALEAAAASNAVGALEQRIAALETNAAKSPAGIWSAAGTGCATISGNIDWTDVADMTVTFKLDKAATVWALYSMNIEPQTAPGTDYVALRMTVDGAGADASGTHYQPFSAGDANANLNGQYVGDLPAGNHTVKLQWATSGTRSWTNCPTWGLGPGRSGSIGARTLVVQAMHNGK